MFCDRCGAELQAGQRFCGSCGKPAGASAASPGGDGRVSRHIQTLAVVWLVASALNLISACAVLLVGHTIFGPVVQVQGEWPIGFFRGLFTTLGMLVLVHALAGFAASWGLFQHEPWARILALIVGFLSLLSFPLGTALGVYTIWVLLPAHADEEYRRLSRAA